ncbi:lycopene cyclase [Subsaximicrobium wynnwilliamsii]|uniref:Lycopene cyclase n=1 Tax=Subsaximicrobium wynnwilliamsii TaxID=291179 RepID=A0A5C6ZIX9_9FLAO|nr:lycopene cyclase family protein [Subsaximicrobium wynnwilliamsii]TXD84232.1 lycopene cyclase [Subsaximicrobium wynnwilliamsii]TXD89853.1 lycopene cyclase [Subsaximicrobium wynnwilliamsii]TXE03944.1 lycopene cyclase [Subsaximicrobium wynnwilliamsii]
MTKTSKHYDYVIIGNGLSGLQLALKMAKDVYFNSMRIALIDPSEKDENDRSWSFWEIGKGQWDAIIHKSWDHAIFQSSQQKALLDLAPYHYKTIRSIDFYEHAKTKLSAKANFNFILEKVLSVVESETSLITTDKNQYTANHIFDSRMPEAYFSTEANKSIKILQHFKGLVIKTERPKFETSAITMMDYRLKDGEQTTFTYVLPFSETEALVEFTYFTAETVPESTYDKYLEHYISEYLKIEDYQILEVETGVIPMTNFPFDSYSTKHLTKIGTAGGWVKGSTGYSFKLTEKKVTRIIENIKASRNPSEGLFRNKYKVYDKIFLKVLSEENEKGEWIFERFYTKNKVQTMFRFLDEESTFAEELSIMSSLFSWSFIKAFFKTL